ncbi:MAG: hypothetical protein IT321_17040 [Anaerolineae bacterium]|nr:hypothetical protein [Anaerolineae bacterium]
MASLNRKQNYQPDEYDEAVSLGSLIEEAEEVENLDYESLEDEKPKRKPKPEYEPKRSFMTRTRLKVAAAVIALLIGVLAVGWYSSPRSVYTVEYAANGLPRSFVLLDAGWLMLHKAVGEIPAGSYVKAMSVGSQPDYFTVADTAGNLAQVSIYDLSRGENPPAADVMPKQGPFSDAIGNFETELVTTEWVQSMPPGTVVRVYNAVAENGVWLYLVTGEGNTIYTVPWMHLDWAEK